MKKNWNIKAGTLIGLTLLSGILFSKVFATHTTTSPIADSHPYGIFENWQAWTNTQYPISTDKFITPLYFMAQDGLRVLHSTSGYSTPRKYSLMDINGDGLVDLLYHNYSNIESQFFAVLLNTGNGYNLIYKCVFANRYYGDCAGAGSVHPYSIFDFNSSSYTATLKPTDKWFHFLYLTGIFNRKPHTTYAYGETQTGNSYDLVDVNGDGLTDMVYRNSSFAAASNSSWPDDATMDAAIFLNEGGTGWQTTYRCRTSYDKVTATVTDIKYYGDCANL